MLYITVIIWLVKISKELWLIKKIDKNVLNKLIEECSWSSERNKKTC